MAPEALARRLTAGLLAFCCVAMACSGRAGDVAVTWKIEPTPPITGSATIVRLSLQDRHGKPVQGAKLQLEAHMSHPGMAPVTGDVIERSQGDYEARVHLSMAGDWVFVVTGELADGSRITRNTRVPAVRPAG